MPPHLTPGNPGNSGGKKGRSGRPTKEFKDFLATLRRDPDVQDAIESAAKGDSGGTPFKAALEVLVRYDEAAPAEKVEHTHRMTDEQREARVLDIVAEARKRREREKAS